MENLRKFYIDGDDLDSIKWLEGTTPIAKEDIQAQILLVESGLIFLTQLFKFKLVNELYLFMSNKKLGNKGLNNIYTNYLRKFQLNNKIRVNLNDDKLYKIKL